LEEATTEAPLAAKKSLLGRVLFIAVCIVFLGYAILAGVSANQIPVTEHAKAACEQQAFSKQERLECQKAILARDLPRQDARAGRDP
jgi:hypothetical protein